MSRQLFKFWQRNPLDGNEQNLPHPLLPFSGHRVGLATLFYLPYQTVKDKTVASFNTEQLLLTRQAARGSRMPLPCTARACTILPSIHPLVRLDETAGAAPGLYAIHTPDLLSVPGLTRGQYPLPGLQ